MKQRLLNLKPSVFIALGLAIAVGLWMWSGQVKLDEKTAKMVDEPTEVAEKLPLIKVRVIESVAKAHQAVIIISGRTEENKLVQISAETDGRFISIDLEEGQSLTKGQIIAKLAVEERNAIVARTQALVAQREMEYEAAKKLADKGFQSKTKKSAAAAYLSAAKADLVVAKIDLNNTVVTAPFDGVVKTKFVDIGGYVKRGEPIAEIVSLNPLYVTGHVAEKEVGYIAVGTTANIRIITGQTLIGTITRIAPVADGTTRTFKIEALVDNPLGQIQAGLTAELRLPLATVPAHLITPALLSLDDNGRIGVKTVTKDMRVIFNQISIIEDTMDGLWIAGLPKEATIISVGQEYVIHGQEVKTTPDQRSQVNPMPLDGAS